MRITRLWALILLGAPVAFLFAFFVVPFGVVFLDSLRTKEGAFTLEHYAKALGDFYYWETLLLTFKLSLFVTVVTLLMTRTATGTSELLKVPLPSSPSLLNPQQSTLPVASVAQKL